MTDPNPSPLHIDWVRDGSCLRRDWSFPDFVTALAFVNRVAVLAEDQNHHPDVNLGYGRVSLSLTTHDTGQLTEQDYALAHAIDALKRS